MSVWVRRHHRVVRRDGCDVAGLAAALIQGAASVAVHEVRAAAAGTVYCTHMAAGDAAVAGVVRLRV